MNFWNKLFRREGHQLMDQELMDAVVDRNFEKVNTMLSKGASPNYKTENGKTALMVASENGDEAIVDLLLDSGADIKKKWDENGGQTALSLASKNGHVTIVDKLLAGGANVNSQGDMGHTALMLAAAYGHLAVVDSLLRNGADVNLTALQSTALKMASDNGHEKIVEILLDAESDGQPNDETLQHSRVTDEDIDCIRDFLQTGARDWWASSDSNHLGKVGACDWYCDEGMGREIKRNDGYLLGRRLLCKPCCDKILQKMAGKPIKALDAAWEVDLFNIALENRGRSR